MARFITTLVVIVVVVGVVLAATGVLRFQDTKDQSIITIDKKELKEKVDKMTTQAEQAGSKALDKTSETLHKGVEELRHSSKDKAAPPEPPANDRQNERQPGAGNGAR
jgi:hypothetical protein